jgi:hypothetical protein
MNSGGGKRSGKKGTETSDRGRILVLPLCQIYDPKDGFGFVFFQIYEILGVSYRLSVARGQWTVKVFCVRDSSGKPGSRFRERTCNGKPDREGNLFGFPLRSRPNYDHY